MASRASVHASKLVVSRVSAMLSRKALPRRGGGVWDHHVDQPGYVSALNRVKNTWLCFIVSSSVLIFLQERFFLVGRCSI